MASLAMLAISGPAAGYITSTGAQVFMSRQDEEKPGVGKYGESRADFKRQSDAWTGPPITSPTINYRPFTPVQVPSSAAAANASSSLAITQLQLRLAELYANELGAPFDQNYLLVNQRELAKAYVEKHKQELGCLYLARQYALENGLDSSYVEQYPDQLAQNYIMGHALELATAYVQAHKVELSAEYLERNQMDLAQSFVDEHFSQLAQKYVVDYPEAVVDWATKPRKKVLLPTLEMPHPQVYGQEAGQKPAPVAQAPVPAAPGAATAQAPVPHVQTDIPTVAILTGRTGELAVPGFAGGNVAGPRPAMKPRPRRRPTQTIAPMQPASEPADSNFSGSDYLPTGPAVAGQPVASSGNPDNAPNLSDYAGGQAWSGQANTSQSYAGNNTVGQNYLPQDAPAAPFNSQSAQSGAWAGQENQSYAYDAAASQSFSGASEPGESVDNQIQAAASRQYSGSTSLPGQISGQPGPAARAGSGQNSAYTQMPIEAAADADSGSGYVQDPAGEKAESHLSQSFHFTDDAGEPLDHGKFAPPPLSGSYAGANANLPWGQAMPVPMSNYDGMLGKPLDNYVPLAGPPPGSAGAAPVKQFMSGLSQAAFSGAGSPLARLAAPPPALRSEGAAAEVTSAWF